MSSLFKDFNSKNHSKFNLLLGLGSLGVLLAALLFWVIFEKTSHPSSSASYSAPLLKPDYETFKIKAPNPGGSTILHQDKEIYNQLIKKEEKLESPEEDFSGFSNESLPFLEESTETTKKQPLPPPSLESLYTHDSDIPLPKEEPSNSWSEIFDTLLDQGLETTLEGSSFYCVTLPPVSDKEQAHTEWRRLRSNNKMLLHNLPMTIIRTENSDGKIQFQIQIGVFKSKPDAESICLSLQHHKIPCQVTDTKGP
ncbi:MAG: hypothetical protein B7Y25_06685 [Alphaproteobacteria bacterium 16-39-46]|nr:MAG: hypothetical protein B7Y25_06685 [Alphaproteobacteria bacterium 16-39-46]OZA42219.1 MAG: hypothetical protein B7X84_06760 [Alphaproteobacteria bacterium 17-39-52]HQS84570.1 SPOR domain-containing protein [Alphaproteobacteria bacterium]HQS94359.1 SPOR domain-containing protein [Alphaproteobacteria bacterium]